MVRESTGTVSDPLSPEELRRIDAYWRAANYLAMVHIGLKDPLIFPLQNQLVSHTQSEIERSPSLPRLSLRGESRAAGRV